MEIAILFRSLSDSLTDDEFSIFTSMLFNHYGKRNIILKSLFHLLTSQIEKQSTNQDGTTINNIVSGIIQSRSLKTKQIMKQKKEEQQKLISINSLSSDLINECASYLNISSYISFQTVNRHIFIASNKSVSLHTININSFRKFYEYYHHNPIQYLKINKYRQIYRISINAELFKNMTILHHQNKIFLNIKSLSLHDINPRNIETILQSKCWDPNSINIIHLERFYITEFHDVFNVPRDVESASKKHFNTFSQLMRQFKQMQFLQLSEINIDDIYTTEFNLKLNDQDLVCTLFSNVKGFCFGFGEETYSDSRNSFYNLLLQHLSDELVSLHVNFELLEAPLNGFCNLKELRIHDPDYNTINIIIKTAKQLEKVFLYIYDSNKEDKLNDVLVDLLSQPTLISIDIVIGRNMTRLRDVFSKINFVTRSTLKLRLSITTSYNGTDIVDWINIMSSRLKKSGNHFLFETTFMLTEELIEIMDKTFNADVSKSKEGELYILTARFPAHITRNELEQKWIHPCTCIF